jgi:hypothetical protein
MVNLVRVQKSANETLGSEFKPETSGYYFEELDLPPNVDVRREVAFMDRH